MYKLHGFSQSGHTYKVAFMLAALKQAWEPVFVDYLGGETHHEAWRSEFNEMGEVPILVDGKKKVSQSGAILDFLSRKHSAFLGETHDQRLEALRWILFDNHKFTSCFASYRYLKSFAPGLPDPAVLDWLKGRIDSAFGIVDHRLSKQSFLVGQQLTIADFSLCGYLFYPMEESGYDIAGRFPNIAAWLDRLRLVPGWAPPDVLFPRSTRSVQA